MNNVICPKCKAPICIDDRIAACTRCPARYPILGGIIKFADTDTFYEGRFGADTGHSSVLARVARAIYRSLAVSVDGLRMEHERLYRNLQRDRPKPIKVLDIGCGGGKPSLRRSAGYHLTGVDLSIASLTNAKKLYDEVYCASTLALPFEDSSFDCVSSFDLIGHVPIAEKTHFLSEILRVLRPGGATFHYIEVDATKGYNKWAKSYPMLYKKYFVDLEGHVGLEPYRDVLTRFKEQGFSVLGYKGLAKFVLPPGEFAKRFSNEYAKENAYVRCLASLDELISSNILTKALVGLLLKPLSITVEPLVPDDYSGLLYVACSKPMAAVR